MIRRYGSHGLHSRREIGEDVNPMDSVGNMADAMLVLAVGIMLALVMHWDVDLRSSDSTVEVEKTQEVDDVEDVDEDELSKQAAEQGLTEMGVVYEDPETGKLYLITEDEESE